MSAQPCLPQDIIEVNKHKEYTLIATALLESVLTDSRLNAQSIKLWQILFNQARYNPNFDIKVSYAYLAKKLGKSTRTISRYVESLQNTGYLVVMHNFDKNGGQRPSTILVRVPQLSITHAKNKKDRHTKNSLPNNDLLIGSVKEPCLNQEQSRPVNATENTSEITDVLHRTYHDDRSSNQRITAEKERPQITVGEQLTQTNIDREIINSHVKNDKGGHDINDIQKESNKKEINNNNNNVVFSFNAEKTKAIQHEISMLEQQLADGNKKLTAIKKHDVLYDQMKRNSQIEASLHLSKIALERLQKETQEKTVQQEKDLELSQNPAFMLQKTGQRILPTFTFNRLLKTLKSYGYKDNILNMLVNEIVFEARFGALVNCTKTQKPLSLDNSINIALKLIREKRWSTPTLLR